MRVLITRDRQSAGGGIASFFHALHKFFTVDVKYITIGRPFSFHGKFPLIARLTFTRLLFDYLKLILGIISFRPDIVHINSSLDKPLKAIRRDSIKVLISKLFRRKVLVFWHGWYWKGRGEFPYKGGNTSLICGIYKLADAYVVLSRQFEKDLGRWGFDKPVFVETTAFDRRLLDAGERASISGADETVNLLFLSSVLKDKGIIELIEAYKILRRKGLKCKLTIAGAGPYLRYVEDHVAEDGIPDVVFTGYVTGEKKMDVYRDASIYCFPSYHEGMAVTVLEAMVMGLPMVTSDVGGLNDILTDGKTGLIVHKTEEREDGYRFDPAEIAEKIERLIKDKALREEMSRHNVKYAKEEFCPKKVAEKLEYIYGTIIGR